MSFFGRIFGEPGSGPTGVEDPMNEKKELTDSPEVTPGVEAGDTAIAQGVEHETPEPEPRNDVLVPEALPEVAPVEDNTPQVDAAPKAPVTTLEASEAQSA